MAWASSELFVILVAKREMYISQEQYKTYNEHVIILMRSLCTKIMI